jgi:hypothetical protein
MVCVWATSIELSWGIRALHIIVKNVGDWVHTNVKPEISRWIHDIRQDHLQTYSLTPSGDTVKRRRRAASCEPTRNAVDSVEPHSTTLSSRYHSSPRKVKPTLPHGATAPGSLKWQSAKHTVPEIQLNGLMTSDDGGVGDSPDEGYSSTHCDSCQESEEDEEKSSSAYVRNDKPSGNDSDASYVTSSLEDESTESEDVEDEESDDDGADSSEDLVNRGKNRDDYDLSDTKGYSPQLNHQSRKVSRVEAYCTPTKVYGRSKLESSSKENRRRSSRF